MASAYTPGLTVSARTTIVKTRRLPLKGDVLVELGERVTPETTVARASLQGVLQTVKVAAALGVDPSEVPDALTVAVGDSVKRRDVIARSAALWGLLKSDAKASADGTIELVSKLTGNVGIRLAPTPIALTAYIPGEVTRILPGEGVDITAHGALIQGIFGVGGERSAPLTLGVAGPDRVLGESDLSDIHAGKIVIGGSLVTAAALRRAGEVGALGIIAGGIVDTELRDFLGYDIGVAITGHEEIPFSLVLTEGFGTISMATKTFDLLGSLAGRRASLSGATQIRAGVIRPEVIVADSPSADSLPPPSDGERKDDFSLGIGVPIRLIREPYFGVLARVESLPSAPTTVGSGASVRVLTARLPSGEIVTVPRSNVEIVGG